MGAKVIVLDCTSGAFFYPQSYHICIGSEQNCTDLSVLQSAVKWSGVLGSQVPRPTWEVGRENEPPESGEFYFRGF